MPTEPGTSADATRPNTTGSEFDLLHAIIRHNHLRMIIPMGLAMVSIMIVLLLGKHYEWGFGMKVTWFSIMTLVVLVVLCIWAFAYLRSLNLLLKQIEHLLPPVVFGVYHQSMASATRQVERVKVLEGLIRACRALACCNGGPFFAQVWFARLTRRLEASSRDPDNALRVLETGAADLPGDPAWRSFAQFCLTGLLFIGIIGTFLGLLGVFTPATFTPLLDAMRTPHGPFTESLGGLLHDFGLAFGASLVAYVAYLFGRFTADLVDEAHDEVSGFLTAEFLGGIRLVLTPLQIDMRVDLPTETKALFEDRVRGIQSATDLGREQMAELRHLNSRFAELAVLFRRATTDALNATRAIATGLREGREEWQAAARTWATCTTEFKTVSGLFGTTVRRYVSAVDHTIKETDDAAQQVIKTWQEGTAAANASIAGAIGNVTSTWYTNNRLMAEKLRGEADAFAERLTELRKELAEVIVPFAEARMMVARATEVVDGGQRELVASVQQVVGVEEQFVSRLLAMLEAQAAALGTDIKDIAGEMKMYRAELQQIAHAQGDLRAVLLGDGHVPDLLTVLQRVDDTLSRIGLTFH
jgi:hypothetical protein